MTRTPRPPETIVDYVRALPKSTRVFLGVVILPLACTFAVLGFRELITRNSKTFQDTAGLVIVGSLSVLGPGLAQFLPRLKPLHWIPVILAGGLQSVFIMVGKPVAEWWLIWTIAPFTVGAPVASLVVFKRWFVPQFGLAPASSRQE